MTTAATIFAKLGLDTSRFDAGLAGASAKATAMGSGFGAVTASMQSAGKLAFMGLVGGAALAGTAVAGVGLALGKLTVDATPIPGLQNAFDGLAERADMSGDALLKAMQEGSGGMVSMRDLMQQANLAAALVSDEFAYGLPDAMGLVQKAAAATGQDMGFMMDSLVKGVGRASPMILDNLGIQVSLTEATEAYAATLGKSTEELSKAEQQEAVRLLTMEKLNEKYGDMASVNDTAAAKIAQFKATIQDTKDQIGVAFLPTLSTFMNMFSELAKNVLPIVTGALENIAPTVEFLADTLFIFVRNIINGMSPLEAFRKVINEFFPPEISEKIQGFIDKVIGFVETVRTAMQPIMDWIANNIQLKDVLIAIGILIASWLVPTLISFIGTIISALAPVVAAFLGVLAVVVLLRKAWETDFLGMRTAITEAWTNTILPALQQLWQWLQVNVPLAIETLKTYWTEVLLPAILEVWAWIQTNLLPVLQELWNFLGNVLVLAIQGLVQYWNNLVIGMTAVWTFIQEKVVPIFQEIASVAGVILGAALSAVASIWENVLLPAINAVWQFIQDNVMPIFDALAELFDVALTLALTALAGLWENVLQPALKFVWEWVKDKVIPIFEALKEFWDTKFGPIIETVAAWLEEKLQPAFDGISNVVSAIVGWIETLTEKLKNIKLPDWLTPGSPTPFEIGLWGVLDALKAVNKEGFLDSFQGSIKSPDLSVDGEVSGTGQTNNYNFNAVLQQDEIIQTIDQLKALA
jgi:hypothetical protein